MPISETKISRNQQVRVARPQPIFRVVSNKITAIDLAR